MSTCKSHEAYPPGKYNSDVAKRIVQLHDDQFQCQRLLDEQISSSDSRKVKECLADGACDATKYDIDVLDRVVVCSTAYENLTKANCRGDAECETIKSHIGAAYDGRGSSMEHASPAKTSRGGARRLARPPRTPGPTRS